MKQMFRYQFHVTERRIFALTSNPVHVAASDEHIEFWAEHDDDGPTIERTFFVVGTGHPIPPDSRYTGTAPRTRSGLVWHLYEDRTPYR